MGRLVTFLARILQDGWASQARGLGIDSQTAVLVDASGSASVVGSGTAYFMQTQEQPAVCQPKMPLTFQNVSVYRVDASGTFDFSSWTGSNGTAYQISADAGVLTTTQPGGGVY